MKKIISIVICICILLCCVGCTSTYVQPKTERETIKAYDILNTDGWREVFERLDDELRNVGIIKNVKGEIIGDSDNIVNLIVEIDIQMRDGFSMETKKQLESMAKSLCKITSAYTASQQGSIRCPGSADDDYGELFDKLWFSVIYGTSDFKVISFVKQPKTAEFIDTSDR